MIDFELSDSQKNIREMVRWFAREEVRPIALESDKNHEVPLEFLKKSMALGLGSGTRPKALGGDGEGAGEEKDAKGTKQGNRVSIILGEEIAWGDPAVVLCFPGPGLGGPPVQFTGTPEQKRRAFGIFKSDDVPRWGAYALTEPAAGSDVAGIQATARKDGNHYILNGRKCFITNGGRATWNVVFATVDKTQGRAGHRAFLVFKDTPGFSVGKIEDKLGLRASETAELVLEDCKVHVDDLLGGEAHYESANKGGFTTAMKTFDSTRPMVAAMAVGIARAAYDVVRDHIRENYLLSRPIARYHVLADLIATMERKITAARLMCWRAAWMADEGIPNSKEASMSKAYAAQVASWACTEAVGLMGHLGTYHANLVEKLYRDVKVYDIFEGTGQVQRIVISRRLLKGL